jgi:hypothetical protein
VNEAQGGRSNVGFSYRVVAKRKDIVAKRLATLQKPTRSSDPHLIPAPLSREWMSRNLDLSDQQLAQFATGADIRTPPKPDLSGP